MSTEKSVNSLALQCFGFLVVSILLGTAYNRLSPLGVRGDSGSAEIVRPAKSGVVKYENTTIRLEVKPLKPAETLRGGGSNRSSADAGTLLKTSAFVPGIKSPAAADHFRSNRAAASGAKQSPSAPAIHFFPTLSWPEVKAEVETGRAVLVDTRMPKYFEAGAIPGAIPLYAGAPTEELAAFVAKYPPKTPLILYCYSANCMIADHFAEKLKNEFKFSSLRILEGGYEEYRISSLHPGGVKAP